MSWFDDNEGIITGLRPSANKLFNGDSYKYKIDHIRNNVLWETREGDKIRFDDMETSHIKNCIKMLSRRGYKNDNLLIDVFGRILLERNRDSDDG